MKEIGFTLIELLIVLIIVGILATLSFVNYSGVKERSLGKEAQANLKLIAAAEKIYHMETAFYYPRAGSENNPNNINANLKLSLSENNWDYSISGATASNFTASADRLGSGGYLNCVYSLNQDQDEPVPVGANCP